MLWATRIKGTICSGMECTLHTLNDNRKLICSIGRAVVSFCEANGHRRSNSTASTLSKNYDFFYYCVSFEFKVIPFAVGKVDRIGQPNLIWLHTLCLWDRILVVRLILLILSFTLYRLNRIQANGWKFQSIRVVITAFVHRWENLYRIRVSRAGFNSELTKVLLLLGCEKGQYSMEYRICHAFNSRFRRHYSFVTTQNDQNRFKVVFWKPLMSPTYWHLAECHWNLKLCFLVVAKSVSGSQDSGLWNYRS